MRAHSILLVLATAMTLSTARLTTAQIAHPDSISFQGRLTDTGGLPINDTVDITTKLFKGGVEIFSQLHSNVQVSNGVFDVVIGPVDTVEFDQPIEVGVVVEGEEISPRTALQSVPFALGLRGVSLRRVGPGMRVGVGTDDLGQDLNVDDADGDNDAMIRYRKIASGADMIMGISGDDYGLISVQSNADLVARTNAVERMRINSSGRVGLHSAALEQDLNIADGDGDGDVITRYHKSSSGADMVVGIHGSDYGLISVQNNTRLVFRTNQVERARITGDGRFAVGTTSCDATGCFESDDDYALSVTRAQGTFPAIIANHESGGPVAWLGESGGGYALAVLQNGDTHTKGDLDVDGTLTKGSGSFKIDHPLDPQNKYLYHSFVESPDMKNVYDGTVMLDASGEATVELPSYFQALNADFRYQLTAIGGAAPNLHVARKISDNRFRIAGGEPNMEVSWMVTGTRIDPYAEQNRIRVEVDKPEAERGTYLHPSAYGASH